MGTSIIPNLDSIAEFRILTNNFDAEYGNYSGGQILVVTKSGTQPISRRSFRLSSQHDPGRSQLLLCRTRSISAEPIWRHVWRPTRRNKIFFFADYQGTRMVQGIDTGLITVPSLADRSGNFSDRSFPVTAPLAARLRPAAFSAAWLYSFVPAKATTQPVASQPQLRFPNAQIPWSAWSTPAKNLLRYIPDAQPGT